MLTLTFDFYSSSTFVKMPMKCCVTGCDSNYKLKDSKSEYVTVYRILSGKWKYVINETTTDSVVIYLLNYNDGVLSVKASLSVSSNLSVIVCQYGLLVNIATFKLVLGDRGILDCWSKLSTMLSHLEATNKVDITFREKLANIVQSLDEMC
jgi:hypothetical protein